MAGAGAKKNYTPKFISGALFASSGIAISPTLSKSYAGQDGDNLVMYMNDGTTWGKQTLADASQLEQYKAQDSMSIYLENILHYILSGISTIAASCQTYQQHQYGIFGRKSAGDHFRRIGPSV